MIQPQVPLTNTENEIFPYLLTDISIKELTYRLNRNIKTIDTHCTNIYRKYGVTTRIGLIIKYYKSLVEGQG
jgi:DNA-binding CsgD family transcriptional regulator